MSQPNAVSARLIKCFAVAAFGAISISLPSKCADFQYPTKAFAAKYEVEGTNHTSVMSLLSNGKGSVATVANGNGTLLRTISDYKNKRIFEVLEAMNLATVKPMVTPPLIATTVDAIPTLNATKIGDKVVSSYKCHGWRIGTEENNDTLWFCDEIPCIVQLETTSAAAHLTIHLTLTDFSEAVPDKLIFEVPADCKILGGDKEHDEPKSTK